MDVRQIGNVQLTLYTEPRPCEWQLKSHRHWDQPKVVDQVAQQRVLKQLARKSPLSLSRFTPARISGKRSDALYEREMGVWDRPFDQQFAYTGGRKGDRELLASLAPTADYQLEVAA